MVHLKELHVVSAEGNPGKVVFQLGRGLIRCISNTIDCYVNQLNTSLQLVLLQKEIH